MTPYSDRLKAGEYTLEKDKVDGKRKDSSTTTKQLGGLTGKGKSKSREPT